MDKIYILHPLDVMQLNELLDEMEEEIRDISEDVKPEYSRSALISIYNKVRMILD